MYQNPIQYLKGVGPARAKLLDELGVRTVGDLLHYYPRDWQDRRALSDLSLPSASGLVLARGKVVSARQIPAGPCLGLFKATIATGETTFTAVWFKHRSRRFDVFSQLKKDVAPGADLWLVGRADPAESLAGIKEVHVDEYYPLADERALIHVQRIVPIYALTEGLSQRFLRELEFAAAKTAPSAAPDILPPALLAKRSLLTSAQALQEIHFPGSPRELELARQRLAYEELLLLELAWTIKRRQTRGVKKGFGYEIKRSLLTPFKERLPFQLTAAQKRVVNEIFEDLQKPYPMTRLLQGDVGSGKTVVALAAMLLAVENGYQAALMAPTEILAEQHARSLARLLGGLKVNVRLFTGRKKGELTPDVDIAVGTHALLEKSFQRLKLAVVDEQHRFGVRQRATLRQKGELVDQLIMTATPIPRTLALALYGDLDASTIDEMPPGKAVAETSISTEAAAFQAVRTEVAKGRQAYVVYPVIEESEKTDLQSAKAEYERLKANVFPELRVGLVHGALPGKQKSAVMEQFAKGELDVLVATQVIEVGIDVPNATVMIIQNADRFGLASLHQLRGRIGRGQAESWCFLVGEARSPQAHERLRILAETHDGFRIGEQDLKLRGPGEFLGTAQHGELSLKVADLFKDAELLRWAREDAEELLARDARLTGKENAAVRRRLAELYERQWNWIDPA